MQNRGFLDDILNKYSSNNKMINVNLENKSKTLFKKLDLRYEKTPTLKHNQNLPQNIEGMYKKDDLSLRKNPRVGDKKAEAVAMHEIYHHTQKDNKLELKDEEATANMIEKSYLNNAKDETINDKEIYDELYKRVSKLFIAYVKENNIQRRVFA